MPEFATLEQILAVLREVPDPEIPVVSVIDLGIVRSVDSNDAGFEVVITPTYTGCPATEVINKSIRTALDGAGLAEVSIRTTLSPAWSTDMISEEGRERLRAYGIAPPPKGGAEASLKTALPAECPRCGSTSTREISRFGSTPCKALWQCNACQEPFDRFKCH